MSRGILYEAESTGRLLDTVKTHYDSLHLSTHREELVDLLLARVEGHVADVERGALEEFLLVFLRRELRDGGRERERESKLARERGGSG